MKKSPSLTLIIFIVITIIGLCLAVGLTVFGSGIIMWLTFNQPLALPSPTIERGRSLAGLPSATPSPTTTPTLTATSTPSPTSTPTNTSTPVPSPTMTPSLTPLPPTATLPPLPTATPTDTPPPVPSFPFVIKETEAHETNHLNFDVYIAITDAHNKPLSGYRVIGQHSSGLQVESQVSAGDWTVNSGARQYKGGNLKFEAFNSPAGVWTLQLMNESGQPVAPSLEFPFDAAAPTWYFILYRKS